MLVIIDDAHAKHLALLDKVSELVVKELCRMAMEFISKGTNVKLYSSAAKKLGVSAQELQAAVEGIMHLLTEHAKLMAKDADFRETLESAGMSDAVVNVLEEVYVSNRPALRAILSELAMQPPQYKELDWRADVVLSSRSLRKQAQPLLTMKLRTTGGECSTDTQSHDSITQTTDDGDSINLLQTDPVTLNHLTNCLEAALQEARTPHTRRIMRHIK